jgi:glycosyltransferase involved in cell wall biosynthesis
MTYPLSVIIPCKNERAHLVACIASVRGIATEIIVSDSGSTDGSLEIARSFGCRVIERDYRTYGDFLNWAIPQATESWVLVLDSDERITPPLAAEIHDVLRKPQCNGYRILRRNHFLGHAIRFGPWRNDWCLRLFRRDLGRYEGPSDHGTVKISTGRVGSLKAQMDHFTIASWEQWLRKADRYSRVQAAEWHAAGRRASYLRLLLTPPLRFLRDYFFRLGFLDGAIGLQLSWASAFCCFLKQARLWELHHARAHRDACATETASEAAPHPSPIIEKSVAA